MPIYKKKIIKDPNNFDNSYAVYEGCTFYLPETSAFIVNDLTFRDCSFRTHFTILPKEDVSFVNCGFSGELVYDYSYSHLSTQPFDVDTKYATRILMDCVPHLDLVSFLNECPKLKILSLSRNKLKNLPFNPDKFPLLEELYLDDNYLGKIPEEILKLNNLRKLHVNGNLLSLEIPVFLSEMENLEYVGAIYNGLRKNDVDKIFKEKNIRINV